MRYHQRLTQARDRHRQVKATSLFADN